MFTETVYRTSVDASTGEVIASETTTQETWTPIVFPLVAAVFVAGVLLWAKRRKRPPA